MAVNPSERTNADLAQAMYIRLLRGVLVISLMGTIVGMNSLPVGAQNFNRDVRPILSDRCFACHGPDERANESGVRLDIAAQAYDSGAFVPFDLENSSAIERILSDDPDLVMPPLDSHLELTEEEIGTLKKWVKSGARYDQHWAFKPLPKFVVVPHFSMIHPRVENSIDVFVLRGLESRGLEPAPESERWRWLRRVTFDLTGLPPTPDQVREFLADETYNAYEKVVDRLLESRDFGERMAVPWLDAARYADSYGYQSDQLTPSWPYRDWVVNAFNSNLPYDQFLRNQIAGDLLPEATTEQILATAFNRVHRMTNEGGSVEQEWRTEYVADRVNTFGTAVLGLTLECARCHDHKFDPISQSDYYNLSAFFNNIDEWGMYHDASRVPSPSLLLPDDAQLEKLSELKSNLEQAYYDLDEIQAKAEKGIDDWMKQNDEIDIEIKQLIKPEQGRRRGMVAHWTLDERNQTNMFANDVSGGATANTRPANGSVPGYKGLGVKLTGDDAMGFPIEGEWLEPWMPFSISVWLKVPAGTEEAVILHRQGGTDVGTFGSRLSIAEGKLRFEITRFWPGNAIAIESVERVANDKWIHVVVNNHGHGRAAALDIYVDGDSNNTILRNRLEKDPQFRPGNGSGFVVGEQFRRIGFKNGIVDEVSFFTFPLSKIEVVALKNDKESVRIEDHSKADWLEHRITSTGGISERSEPFHPSRELLVYSTGIREISVMREMKTPRPAYVLHRGEYDSERSSENLAQRATPKALPEMDSKQSVDRLGLANWVLSEKNPLTARVAVNRFWQEFFGAGLIDTPNDLGYQSQMPLHNGLLDYLSREFIDSGWDVKALCKKIVLSNTYRQSSVCSKEAREQDPENRYLARGPAVRLSAEMIRDTALFASGLLNANRGGPAVSPYQPLNIWRENNTMTPAYNQSVGTDLYRRSLYSVWKRTTPMPNMMTFDATSREVCVVQRGRTNTPQQAMVLLNDVQFVEAARVLAEKVIDQLPEADDQTRIAEVFLMLGGRPVSQAESELLLSLYQQQKVHFGDNVEDATKLVAIGSAPAANGDVVNVAAMTVVVQAVLNSDATIWKR